MILGPLPMCHNMLLICYCTHRDRKLVSFTLSWLSAVLQGHGVDVVLNSLTSTGFVAGSLAALEIGGHFVEISKRDIWSHSRVTACC